jgi:hypothetical protein
MGRGGHELENTKAKWSVVTSTRTITLLLSFPKKVSLTNIK